MELPVNQIICGDCKKITKNWPKNSVDLIIADPPYQKGFHLYFDRLYPKTRQMLWFAQPMEGYDLPKPLQILIWNEPYGPKPIHRKYVETFDIIYWYAKGDYTFNPLLWNLMCSIFEDRIISHHREHIWQKPLTLMERLIQVHTNPNDLILEPFCGSGSACIAAKRLGRNYIGIETSKELCQEVTSKLAKISRGSNLELDDVQIKKKRRGFDFI